MMNQHFIAPNGEIIAPTMYGVDVFDPETGVQLHAAHDWVPIEARFAPEFVATLRPYDPVAEPNPPELVPPVVAPLPVLSVSKRQAALALYDAGKYSDVMTALAQDPRADVEWQAAAVIERNSPLVQQLGAALGLDLDALFAHAATL